MQLSGNDETALAFNAMGGVGCISVSANVAPRLCADFQAATREGRWDERINTGAFAGRGSSAMLSHPADATKNINGATAIIFALEFCFISIPNTMLSN